MICSGDVRPSRVPARISPSSARGLGLEALELVGARWIGLEGDPRLDDEEPAAHRVRVELGPVAGCPDRGHVRPGLEPPAAQNRLSRVGARTDDVGPADGVLEGTYGDGVNLPRERLGVLEVAAGDPDLVEHSYSGHCREVRPALNPRPEHGEDARVRAREGARGHRRGGARSHRGDLRPVQKGERCARLVVE